MAETPELVRFFQGWVELFGKDTKGKATTENVWMVLKGDHVFLFTHQTLRTEEYIKAFFPINVKSTFERKTKEEKKHGGYIFEIRTEKDGKKYDTKYKVEKRSDLETLRGFIYGISKGKLPKDIDLPKTVQDGMMNTLLIHQQYKRGNYDLKRHTQRRQSEQPLNINVNPPGNPYLRRQSLPNINQSPTVQNEVKDDILKKPYFFSECTRDKALEIFRTAGCRFGNTMLRGNSSSIDDNHYAITYCTHLGRSREPEFTHFEVKKCGTGYGINIEECEGQIIPCLSDVMEVFVEVNGSERTYPMTTNDLSKLLMPEDDESYSRHIPSREEIFNAFGVRILPGDGPRGGTGTPEEPKEDYDNEYTTPVSSPTRTTVEDDSTSVSTQHNQMLAELTKANLRSSIPSLPAPPPPTAAPSPPTAALPPPTAAPSPPTAALPPPTPPPPPPLPN